MNKGLGIAVLVIGLGGLGLWGGSGPAKRIEAGISEEAASVVGVTTHGMEVAVSGRDITLTGIANDAAEREQMLATLGAVPGVRTVVDGLVVLPLRSPFSLEVDLAAEGGMRMRGQVPSEAARGLLSDAVGTEDAAGALELAAGAPDAEWPQAAKQGLEALGLMNFGALALSDTALTLTGEVLNPGTAALVEAALADLPEGYSATLDLTQLDDGLPFGLTLTAEAGVATWQAGKLPASLHVDALDDAFGNLIEGDMVFARIGEEEADWPVVATNSVRALSGLKSGTLVIDDRGVTLTGLAALPTDAAVVEAAMGEMPEGFEVTLEIDIEDDGMPFALELTKTLDGVNGLGKLPASLLLEDLDAALGEPVLGAIDQARIGAEETVFTGAVRAGLAALAALEQGSLKVDALGAVSLTGTVTDPDAMAAAQAALAALPEGAAPEANLAYTDDGQPFRLDLLKGPRGLSGTGKLPAALQLARVRAAQGQPVSGAILQAYIGEEKAEFAASVLVGLEALEGLKTGRLLVEEGTLSLTGLAANPAAVAAVEAALEGAPEGIAVTLDLEQEDDGRPFVFTAERTEAGTTVSGKLPAAMRGVDLGPEAARALAAGDLSVARIGAEDTAFGLVVPAGLRALAEMEAGTFGVTPEGAQLTGLAFDPAAQQRVEAHLTEVPYVMDIGLDLELLDDGQPVAVRLRVDASAGARVEGKLPSGLDAEALALTLGLPVADLDTTQAARDDTGASELQAGAAALQPVLRQIEAAEITWTDGLAALTVQTPLGADPASVEVALNETLDPAWAISVTPAGPAQDGAARTNAFTGSAELSAGGIWVPDPMLEASLEACSAAGAVHFEGAQFAFAEGSADLTLGSELGLRALTGVLLTCLQDGTLRAEIGAHTDLGAGVLAGFDLSDARALALRALLVERGIPEAGLSATGFGPSQPIASNSTAEGRAQNQRITLTWTAQDG